MPTIFDNQPDISIGTIIQNGIVFQPAHGQGAAMHTDQLVETVANLFHLLEQRQIAYLLVGGIAMRSYVEGRNTEDIDLIMALSSLHKLPEIQVISQDQFFARGSFAGLQIDILLTQNPVFALVHEQYATTRPFQEQTLPCATVEGLLLLKLYALPALYRQGNFARVGLYENDIATLLHTYPVVLDPLLNKLAPHLSASDQASIRDVLADIAQRLARFGRERKP
jgi:predicted nucleotidyltransferase